MDNKNKYDVILLITPKNLSILKVSIPYIKANIGAEDIYGIASRTIKEDVLKLGIKFLDEDNIIEGLTLESLKKEINFRGLNEGRAGWYFQQFIKYAYSNYSKYDYYLAWDSDTIPLKKISYFLNNSPSLIEKKECHSAYFRTIQVLFNGEVYRTNPTVSYVAENMMFNKRIVQEIMRKITVNSGSGTFYEGILNAISRDDFESGFSEFETYGNYVDIFYPAIYRKMKLSTLRNGSFFLGRSPEKEQLEWARRDYDIVSIEGRQLFIAGLSKYELFRRLFRLKDIAGIVLRIRSFRRKILRKEKLDYE